MKKIFYVAMAITFLSMNACQQNAGKSDEKLKSEEAKVADNNANNANPANVNNAIPQDTATKNPNAGKLPKAKQGEEPIIEFVSKEHNFGEIKEGDVVKHAFKFKNTGKTPLVIEEAKPGCGCTVPKWPKEPIPPGGESEIVAEFKTQGQGGGIKEKSISIKSNTNPAETILKFKANINAVSNAKGPLKQ
ncbi:MAG: DUF1573 domain-containing protein [Cytophagia bacterium]|nr:MAG: DUF1573 domain-containing protein [Cytophagia bacterium]TAG45441.1 MAG: DUF1573 domain-containing protein [Cytophagia bacterium]